MVAKKIEKHLKQNPERFINFVEGVNEDDCIIFRELQKDTIGKSGSNPTWGYVYNYNNKELKYKGIGLLKEYDYDAPDAAYSEKLWSIVGKRILKNVRVPNIELVKSEENNIEIISYRVMDNDKEDMIHIKDIMFNKFQRDELKEKKDIYYIEDILECIKLQVNNEENYKKLEKNVIHTFLLDSITNNGDRHANNWALVRNKKTSNYELAIFDHSSAFTDMIKEQQYFVSDGWVGSYAIISKGNSKNGMGCLGGSLIEYIKENYNEYFEEFFENFKCEFPKLVDEIELLDLNVDIKRLIKKLKERRHYLRTLSREGELEYE